jgi:GNAT superfamily N-acetyltransferase
VRIEPFRPAARADFLELLALATPGEPLPVAVTQATYLPQGSPPFTHGPAMCLTAYTTDSNRPVGALVASPPEWAFTHPLTVASPWLSKLLQHSVLCINGVAVRPDHRGLGVARALIDSAERRARRAGFGLAILEHERHMNLTGFYQRLGYTVADNRLIVAVPASELLCQQLPRRYKIAAKPLTAGTRVLTVPGAPAPVISGLLPGCDIPPTARFRNGILTA